MINNERMMIQKEALSALQASDYNGIFLLPTGTGKSWVMINALKQILEIHPEYENIWYLCNSTDLRDKDFDAELDKWGAAHLKDRIEKMCYQTAYKLQGFTVDVLLADEFDYSLTPEYSKVYDNNDFRHKILTTAYIEGKVKNRMALKIAPIVYSQELQEAESRQALNKSQYYYVVYPLTNSENEEYLNYNSRISNLMFDLNHYRSNNDRKGAALVEDKLKRTALSRKQFLNSLESSAYYTRKLMKEIYEADQKCKILTFCELTAQADKICKYSYHGKNTSEDNLTKFRNDEIQFLTVCGKVNRGVNIKGIKYQIYESCPQSITALRQRLGRGKRLEVHENLSVYFMIPTYVNRRGQRFHTKVLEWVQKAAKDLDMSQAKLYKFRS